MKCGNHVCASAGTASPQNIAFVMKNATEEKPENMKQVPGQQRLPAVLQERDTKEGGHKGRGNIPSQLWHWTVGAMKCVSAAKASVPYSIRRGVIKGAAPGGAPGVLSRMGLTQLTDPKGKRWGHCLFSLTCTFVGLKYNLTGFQLQPPVQSLSRARRGKKKLLLCFMWKITCSVTPESPIHAKLHYPLKYVPCALPNALVSVFLFSYALLTCL